MKRCLSLLFLAIVWTSPAFAQFTTVTATVQDPNGIPYAGAVLNAVLVPSTGGGYTLSGQPYSGRIGPVTLDSAGKFTVNFGDVTLISPGSPQWQITIDSAAATLQGPLGTGAQSFIYTSTGTTISGTSPVSLTTALNALAPKLTNFASAGLAPNTPGIPQQNGPGMIYAYNYGVLGDAKQNCFGSTVNGSNTVTLQQPGDLVLSADLGDIVFVTNGRCYGDYGNATTGTVLTKGFICSVASSTSFTIGLTYPTCAAANASATCTATPATTGTPCPVNWGPRDDGANLNTFFAAVVNATATSATNSCGEGVLPDGRALTSLPVKARNVFCGANSNNGTPGFWSWSVHGGAIGATVIVPLPSFDAAGCVAYCFFDTPDNAVTGASIHDITVDGGGNGTVLNGTNKYAFGSIYSAGSGIWNLNVTEWGMSGTNNFAAFNIITTIGSWMDIHGLHAYNGGSRCGNFQGAVISHLDCLDPKGATIVANGVNSTTVTSQSFFGCQASFAQGGCVQVVQNAVWRSKQDTVYSTANPGSSIQVGGTAYLDDLNINCSGSVNCHGIDLNDTTDSHSGTVYLKNTSYLVTGGTSVGNGVSGSQVFDQCGNTGFTGAVWTNISYTACQNGPSIGAAPTISGTGGCATQGSQTPASVGGWTGSFACTGTTGTGTITLTFGYTAPGSIWNCNLNDETTAQTWRQTGHSNISCTWTSTTNIATNDVITWTAAPQ
jgi:hypothetical protein